MKSAVIKLLSSVPVTSMHVTTSQKCGLLAEDMSVALRNVNKNIAADACTHWCALHDVPDDARTGREGAAFPAILWQHPANWSHQAS